MNQRSNRAVEVAKLLVERQDPRIDTELARMRSHPASPDAAYWQAALQLAERDTRTEELVRSPAYGCGYLLGRIVAAALWTTFTVGPVAAAVFIAWHVLS